MIYFTLPNTNNSIYKYIDCIFSDENEHDDKFPRLFDISNSLSFYLYEMKNKIKKYEREWDVYKRYTNPYEFINTVVPGKTKCVSKYKPLSRSYFKMVEMLYFFFLEEFVGGRNVVEPVSPPPGMVKKPRKPMRSFHLAEGPGGFIEALANVRNNPDDMYVGMTILDSNTDISSSNKNSGKHNKSVPGWKKSEYFLKSHTNIYIEAGADNTGNILSMDNFLHCRSKYGSSMDLITGDGGFDFSADFNNQEMHITQLLFAQMCYALCLQKHTGSFILKIFDCFMEQSIDILYILSAFYETVYITKPKTSRYANSEKYLVCKNFLLFDDSSVFPCLKMAFQKMVGSEPERAIYRFLKIPVPSYYIYKLEEYNTIYGQQQIENIYQTIVLIDQNRPETESDGRWELDHRRHTDDEFSPSTKINNLVRINLRKCVQWCLNHNIPYNIMDEGY